MGRAEGNRCPARGGAPLGPRSAEELGAGRGTPEARRPADRQADRGSSPPKVASLYPEASPLSPNTHKQQAVRLRLVPRTPGWMRA